jgi:hypothetical protein
MISASMDRGSVREFKRLLREYEKKTGDGIEEGIIDMAKSTARRLAHTVPPYGTSQAIGQKFEDSIGAQIDYAWYGASRGAFPSSSMEAAHAAARNNRGVVRMRKFRRFKDINENISVGEKEAYKRKKIKNAGIAKAGWVAAGESTIGRLGRTKSGKVKMLSGIAKWIRRHVNSKLGSSGITRNGMSTTVDLTNKVDYIQKLHKESEQNRAIEQGRRNGIARLKHILKGTTRSI